MLKHIKIFSLLLNSLLIFLLPLLLSSYVSTITGDSRTVASFGFPILLLGITSFFYLNKNNSFAFAISGIVLIILTSVVYPIIYIFLFNKAAILTIFFIFLFLLGVFLSSRISYLNKSSAFSVKQALVILITGALFGIGLYIISTILKIDIFQAVSFCALLLSLESLLFPTFSKKLAFYCHKIFSLFLFITIFFLVFYHTQIIQTIRFAFFDAN